MITMVSGYARWLAGRMIPSRCTEDLFAGQWELIRGLGAVPRALVWDGEGAVDRWRGRRAELTQATQAFRGPLGIKVVLCKAWYQVGRDEANSEWVDNRRGPYATLSRAVRGIDRIVARP